MGLWEQFPYPDYHNLNLDWILQKIKEFGVTIDGLDEYIEKKIKEGLDALGLEQIVIDILSKYAYAINVKTPPNGLLPASGNGTTNDYATIQGCIDYASSIGGGVVFFPYGKYLTNSLSMRSNVSILGFDQYSTKLILSGGANKPLLSGTIDNVSISGLTLNAKQSSQVNNIDAIKLLGHHINLENVIAEDCYTSINIEKNGTSIVIKNVICNIASDACLRVGGTNGGLLVDGLDMTGLSTNLGTAYIVTDSNDDIYRNINIHGSGAIGVDVSGSGNYFDGNITGVTKDYDDISGDNTFNLFGKTRVEVVTGEITENANAFSQTAVNGIERQGANISDNAGNAYTVNAGNAYTVNAKDVVLNPTNPLTYKTPEKLSDIFDYISMKDTVSPYKVLVAGENIHNISQSPIYKDFEIYEAVSGNTVNSLTTNVKFIEVNNSNKLKIYSNFGNALDIVEMSKITKANASINGAIYGNNFSARGINIINGTIISDEKMTGYDNVYTLCFKEDGILHAVLTNSTTATELINQGYTNAVQGWTALMIDGVEVPNDEPTAKTTARSAIGQKPDGTYVLMATTCNDNNVGLDYPTMITLLRSKGCSFIYSLDGGGSSQLAYKNVNLLGVSYDKQYRKVPNFLYFDSLNVNGDYNAYYELGRIKEYVDVQLFNKNYINNIAFRILNTQDTNAGIEFFNGWSYGKDSPRTGKIGVNTNGCYLDHRDSTGYINVLQANRNGISDSKGALAKYYITAPDATDFFYNLKAGEYYFSGNQFAPGLPNNNFVGTVSKSGNYVQAIMRNISFDTKLYYCVSSGGSQKYYTIPLTELT